MNAYRTTWALALALGLALPLGIESATAVDPRGVVAIFGPHFYPENLTILWTPENPELVFVNADKAPHMPTSGPHDDFATEGSCFFAGQILSHSTGGAFVDISNPACASPIFYHCHIHPQMRGNITLQWLT